MTELLRVKVRWSGFTGGPGYSVLHFRDFGTGDGEGGAVNAAAAQGAVDRTRAAFNLIIASLPQSVRIDVEPEVDVIEDTNGQLVNTFATTAPAQVAGTATTTYASSTGANISWNTRGIRNGRRIRGRTFLVPLALGSFDGNGVLAASTITRIQAMANLLTDTTGTPDLGVYARPSSAGATDGQWSVATSGKVAMRGAVLRSRRD